MKPRFARIDYGVGVALALAHLCACYYFLVRAHMEGGYQGVFIVLIDLPVAFLAQSLGVGEGGGEFAMIAGGTLWWFCIGLIATKCVRWVAVSWVSRRPADW